MPPSIQISGLHKHYGPVAIFEDASASFSVEQRIGVIGRNGAGKSTLCRILTGQEEADQGTIGKSTDLHLSYLEQQDPFQLEETILGFLTRYTGKAEWECGKTAYQFQMKQDLLNEKIGNLSGGFRTRVKLTAMMLKEPNFLILDEPTNYLDLNTLILLEDFLEDFSGGFLIVSHDREFLKRTCDHTLEVENGGLTLFPGEVEQYLEYKEEEKRQAVAYNKNVEAKRKQLQSFVDRFRAQATKASQAQSKLKQLNRMKTIEIEHPMSTVRIRIPQVETRTGTALTCADLSIGYPDKTVGKRIHLDVERGSRVAVLGANGQGKTTFLRTIAGDLKPLEGDLRWGYGLNVGYYAQHVYTAIPPEKDVLTYLSAKAATGVPRQDLLDLAGSFLFKGTDVEKKIGVLSGGERARLCLAGLLLSKSPVLLLDEPTNHLDFETVEALANALRSFNGTLFFISHDRTFVSLVATQILEVKEGTVLKYPGKYQEYVSSLEIQARETLSSVPETKNPKAESRKPPEQDKNSRWEETRELQARIRKLEKEMAKWEEEKKKMTEEMLSQPKAWSKERNERLNELSGKISEAEDQWLVLHGQLESLKKNP